MKSIFVSATGTDSGKTYTTLRLIEAFSTLGYRVGVMKPIETGVGKQAEDATLLLTQAKRFNPDFTSIMTESVCPIQFSLPAAPFVAKKEQKIDFKKLKLAHEKLSKYCDILLIEGAGGLMTPVEDTFTMYDFISFFDATPLLITDDALGCINNTLLNLHLLSPTYKDVVWCVNQKSNDKKFQKISLPYFEAKFDTVLSVQNDIKEIAKRLLQK